jgi:hypothetical protein
MKFFRSIGERELLKRANNRPGSGIPELMRDFPSLHNLEEQNPAQQLDTKPRVKFSLGFFTREYRNLFLFSSSMFLITSLAFQVFENLVTTFLLRYTSISFIYRIFDVRFTYVSSVSWPVEQIIVVFGTGALVSFFLGLLLITVKIKPWWLRLAVTWLAFLMMMYFPLAMFGGVLLFKDFGMAYQWMLPNLFLRGVVAIGALTVAIYFRPYWISRFLKTASSLSLIDSVQEKKRYLLYVFILPWIVNMVLIVGLFAFPLRNWLWASFLLGLGVIVLPVFSREMPLMPLKIYKSDKKIFSMESQVAIYLFVIVLFWLVSRLHIVF